MEPNGLQRLAISIMRPLSKAFGLTLGIGVGGSAGGATTVPIRGLTPGGPLLGSAVGASRQLVVSPNGQAAVATSISVGAATGLGGIEGPQISFSNAPTPGDLGGPFVTGGASAADIVGAGADLNFGKGTTNPNQTIFQLNVTGGIGVGGKGGAGGGSVTTVDKICN